MLVTDVAVHSEKLPQHGEKTNRNQCLQRQTKRKRRRNGRVYIVNQSE